MRTTDFEIKLENALAANQANGWQPGQYRIVPARGGFALEEFKPMMNGTPEWTQVAWSRIRKHMTDALALRK